MKSISIPLPQTDSLGIIETCIRQNQFIHKYIIALTHAFLWISALSIAGFFHVSEWFNHKEALLFSTLTAYTAYLCESGLGTWRVAASMTDKFLNFRKAGLWKYVWLNFFLNVVFALLFLWQPSWWWILAVIFTAGWQKYMDGRIPPRLEATGFQLTGNIYKSKI